MDNSPFPPSLFDRTHVQRTRDRIAGRFHQGNDFLKKIATEIIDENLSAINRTFQTVLDLGCHTGELTEVLNQRSKCVVACDLSGKMLRLNKKTTFKVQADEELLPFAPHSFDAIFSSLSMQSVNDVVGMLIQIYNALKPDGLAMIGFLGGDTLIELKSCFKEAEIELTGGLSPRILPMIDVKEAGHLLQRAGFKLPASVSEKIMIQYHSPFKLLQDLRAMGETNSLIEREKRFLRRDVLFKAMELYQTRYRDPKTGTMPATFELITLTGWHHHESQQQPLRPRGGRLV